MAADGKKDGKMTMADLQFAMRDAHQSLRLAVTDNRWCDVAKYAAQLDSMAARHVREHGSVYTVHVGVSVCR
jgi:hypothetical protein